MHEKNNETAVVTAIDLWPGKRAVASGAVATHRQKKEMNKTREKVPLGASIKGTLTFVFTFLFLVNCPLNESLALDGSCF